MHGRVIYPAVVKARGEGAVFRRLCEMAEMERWSAERVRDRQHLKLAAALSYASRHSAFYSSRWQIPDVISGEGVIATLSQLPLVEKSDLQRSFDDLIARPRPRRVTRKTTGGSTGQVVTVLKDRAATASEMAASWLGYGWFGVRIGDRAVRFWGTPFTAKRRLRFAAADLAMHRIRFSAFAFDEADLERYWKRCHTFRPAYFYGYVSMLERFASFLRDRDLDGTRLKLKCIVTTSEVLGEPQRRMLESVFGCPVQNEYGCGEVGPIAYECPSGGLHVMSENVFVEVLTSSRREAEVGESGEVVVTDLNNRAMPLVRYRVGDFATKGAECVCGRPFPVLEKIWGREYDFVETPNGKQYHGEFFMYLFEELRERGLGVGQFQVTQAAEDSVDVIVVVDGAMSLEQEGEIRSLLTTRLDGLRVTLQRVSSIERAPSGKMLVIRNLLRRR